MATPIRYRTLGGTLVHFSPYLQPGTWNPVPGIYCFAYNQAGTWRVLYVGKTDSFQRRIPTHERWAEAQRRGATHVLATVVHGQVERDTLERVLIREMSPPLNVQHA